MRGYLQRYKVRTYKPLPTCVCTLYIGPNMEFQSTLWARSGRRTTYLSGQRKCAPPPLRTRCQPIGLHFFGACCVKDLHCPSPKYQKLEGHHHPALGSHV
uniref:Uncharacterized protein n=1 Tax=Lepeophtheirus salmonis TaxID=72036 RepID=A0A0K2T2C2_LEPSM